MCCVIPPASVAVTLVSRIASSSEVFAMIHVAHDGDHGRALHMVFGLIRHFLLGFGFLFEADHVGAESELRAHFLGDIEIQRLVDGGENSLGNELLDDVLRLDVHLFRQLFDRDAFGDGDRLELLGRSRRTRQFDNLGDSFGNLGSLRPFLPDEP